MSLIELPSFLFFLLNMTVYCNEAQYPSTIVGGSKYGA